MCKKKFQSPCVCSAEFTDRVSKDTSSVSFMVHITLIHLSRKTCANGLYN